MSIILIFTCSHYFQEFMKLNGPHQNKNCLNNFDLSEYRQILSDVAIRIYHRFIVVMENNIQPIIGKKRIDDQKIFMFALRP